MRLESSKVLLAFSVFGAGAVKPVDEELECGIVVIWEIELFRGSLLEVALECCFEIVGAVTEQILV